VTSWRCNHCGTLNTGKLRSRKEHRECENCEKPRGWEYSGPEDIDYNAPDAAERAEMQDRARRIR